MLRKTLRVLLWIVIGIVILPFHVWAVLAIYYSNLPGDLFRAIVAWGYGIAVPAAFAFLPRRGRTLLGFWGCFAVIAIWFTLIPASHDRDWDPSWERVPHATFEGERVTIHDLRDFGYRSEYDFDSRYLDRTYDLGDLQTVDFVLTNWGIHDVGHTMFSFGFRDGEYVTVSVETRREKNEPQTAIMGLFKQYELIYILGTERDLLGLRTNFRREDVFVYPTNSPPEEARAIFRTILERINGIYEYPEYYNTLTENCTTSLAATIHEYRRRKEFNIRLILNGTLDQFGMENGWIRASTSFEEMRKLHRANQYVEEDADYETNYSKKIRPWL